MEAIPARLSVCLHITVQKLHNRMVWNLKYNHCRIFSSIIYNIFTNFTNTWHHWLKTLMYDLFHCIDHLGQPHGIESTKLSNIYGNVAIGMASVALQIHSFQLLIISHSINFYSQICDYIRRRFLFKLVM